MDRDAGFPVQIRAHALFFREDVISNSREKFLVPIGKEKIAGIVHRSVAGAPVIVCCHGLFSTKDSDKFLQIANTFTPAGFTVVRFDFGGCGDSTGDIADTTVTGRLQDLKAVIQYLFSGQGGLTGPYGILGSSLGGYVGLLHAAKNPVAALSVWSTPCELLSLINTIPKADLEKLKQDFFVDARSYDVLMAIESVKSVQIMHGGADELVPVDHAGLIYGRVQEPRDFLLLPEADHALSSVRSREQAIAASLAWFKRQMPLG